MFKPANATASQAWIWERSRALPWSPGENLAPDGKGDRDQDQEVRLEPVDRNPLCPPLHQADQDEKAQNRRW